MCNRSLIRTSTLALLLLAFTTCAAALAAETVLFNGKDLKGWTFRPGYNDDDAKDATTKAPAAKNNDKNTAAATTKAAAAAAPNAADPPWIIQQGLLINTASADGFLFHEGQFENYVLTFDWRSMQLKGPGLAVSGSGSLFIHASDETGSFRCPKSVEVGIFNDVGSVYFRDVEPFAKQKWAFRAPDFADEVEHEMGEWNETKVIANNNRLTVYLNGTPVNQVEGLNLTKGLIALRSGRGSFRAPSYYRNIKLSPLSAASAQDEKSATAYLAKRNALAAQKDAAEAAREREKEQEQKSRAEQIAKELGPLDVRQEIDFTTDVRKLPFPADTRDLEFEATFGDVKLQSNSSLTDLAKFYRTEMAKRGWQQAKQNADDDSIELTFKHGDPKDEAAAHATVELSLDKRSKGVEVSMDTKGLSFEGTNNPAELVALGVPQPKAYVFLQKEIKLPANVRDLEFDGGNRCLFKSDLQLQQLFDQLTAQLRAKRFRETRKPIITADRRYTEFASGRIQVSVNTFTNDRGSRAVLTYEEK
jgi:3-keto-disaccharide hydrolase